jgi:hypothetical protein
MTQSFDRNDVTLALRTFARSRLVAVALASICLTATLACGSDDDSDAKSSSGGQAGRNVMIDTSGRGGSGGSAALGGSTAQGGTANAGGSTGGTAANEGGAANDSGTAAASTGGSMNAAGTGGSTSTAGTGGGSMGMQPLGAICANDGNCSQADGAAVCCNSTCTLSDQCPASTTYLPCNSAADCAAYGGGKICCEVGSGSAAMRFCTKQSACSGQKLP